MTNSPSDTGPSALATLDPGTEHPDPHRGGHTMSLHFTPSRSASRVSAGSLRPTTGVIPPGDINFGIGEPGFHTPEPIAEAFRTADVFEHSGYGDFHGSPELRELIAEQTSTRGQARSADEVLVTSGATSGISATILATVGPGDRVIIPTPAYSLYADAVQMAGAIPVFVPLTGEFQLDLAAIAREVNGAGAQLAIVCNPGNPTGVVLSPGSLAALGELLDGSDTLVLSDEAYWAFDYASTFVSALETESLRERLIYAQTLSKTYSMTGWRVGYIVGPPKVMPWIRQVHRGMVGPINRAAQAAAVEALRQGPALVADHVAEFAKRRESMLTGLASIDGLSYVQPDGAFYVFVKYAFDISSLDMARHLRGHGVVVRAGREFGEVGEGHVRLAYTVDTANIEEGLARIRRAFNALRAARPRWRASEAGYAR